MVEKILTGYGREMTLRLGSGEYTVRGFFQSVTGKNEGLARLDPGPLGLISGMRYVYIGPAEPSVGEGDVLEVDGKKYRVRNAALVEGAGSPVYTWAMCVEKGREDTWGLNG